MSEEEKIVPVVEWTSHWQDIRQLIKKHQAKIMRDCMMGLYYEWFLKNNDDEADTPITIRRNNE